MTDQEFELLDEIYFVRSYDEISSALQWEDARILSTLQSAYKKGWIRCYITPTQEDMSDEVNLSSNYKKYYYLASKEGLFAHNSIE